MRAFEEMQNLEYKNDIAAFNVAAHKAVTELAASGATIQSIMMICIRNTFGSRGQYIRMEIGKDMDDNPDMGISQVLDCLHKYCNMVSSSGEGGGSFRPMMSTTSRVGVVASALREGLKVKGRSWSAAWQTMASCTRSKSSGITMATRLKNYGTPPKCLPRSH